MSVESLLADVKFAFRQFRCTPLFALVTALTLAVGIGANSAIFGACILCCGGRCRCEPGHAGDDLERQHSAQRA